MSDSTAPSDRSWVRRERAALSAICVLSVIALALAATLVINGGDQRPRAALGDVVLGPDIYDEVGQTTEVRLPWALAEVTIGAPVDELPPGSDERQELLRPPAGGSFIRVAIKPAMGPGPTMFRTGATRVSTVTAVLTAGGRDYPIDMTIGNPSIPSLGGGAWVAVDGEPQDASLAITVEGETQVVADGKVSAGQRIAELSDVPSREELQTMPIVGCGRVNRTSTDGLTLRYLGLVKCARGAAYRTSFVDGLGWAEEGRDFLVVFLAMDPRVVSVSDPGGSGRRVRNLRLDVTLDGLEALGSSDARRTTLGIVHPFDSASGPPRQYVFDVPSDTTAGDLEATVQFDAERADPFDTDRRHVELQWRVASGDPR